MIISLPPDFFSFIGDSIYVNSCLENLFYSHFCGNHIVITEAPRAARAFLNMNYHLSQRAKVSLAKIISFSQQNISICKKVLYYLRIESYHDKKTLYPSSQTNIIKKDLSRYYPSDSLHPCTLVCENFNDCDLYLKYFNILCRDFLRSNGVLIKMHSISGGGSTTSNVFSRTCSNSIGICILDSDHYEPSLVINYEGASEKHLFRLEGCREIENTIPLKWLDSLAREKNRDLLFLIKESISSGNKFHLFFDYKQGITKKYIRKVSESYGNKIISFLQERMQISESDSQCSAETCQNCGSCVIVRGFGENILTQFLDYINSLSPKKAAELLVKSDVNFLLKDIIPHVLACAICYKKII